MNVLHICLNVTDAETAVEFYTDELGFEETWSFETDDGKTENRYVADGNGIELQLSETEGAMELEEGTAWDHLAMKVEDVDVAFDRIDAAAVEDPSDQPAAGARTAFVEDPDGHRIELVEPLD